MTAAAPAVGLVEWFEPGEHERAERVAAGLRALGVEHLRTGVSWAEWHVPGGVEWYDWLLPRLARELEVLQCLTFTPPSLGVAPRTSAPPRRARDFADFLDVVVTRHGHVFEYVELWNEPNNLSDWDWKLDPHWDAFSELVGAAAHWARRRGKKTVLGGMSPFDPNWLELMGSRRVLEQIDVVGIHGFPGTWEVEWDGWEETVERARETLDAWAPQAEVWVTECGFSTWRLDEEGQLRAFDDALRAPVPRLYWYSAEDLAPDRLTPDGAHVDERDYHFGLWTAGGDEKLLARSWREHGIDGVRRRAAHEPVGQA